MVASCPPPYRQELHGCIWPHAVTVGCIAWTLETSKPLICLPAPMVLNIGQFLDEDNGHGWGVQHWMETNACALQQVGEAAEGRY